jgi:hypothetical protein
VREVVGVVVGYVVVTGERVSRRDYVRRGRVVRRYEGTAVECGRWTAELAATLVEWKEPAIWSKVRE